MKCTGIEASIMPFIKRKLPDKELELFLEHIKECKSCKEELEIYYILEFGIGQHDLEEGSYNIKGELEYALEDAQGYLERVKRMKIARYSVTTLWVMALLTSILLQCRIWWQRGLF